MEQEQWEAGLSSSGQGVSRRKMLVSMGMAGAAILGSGLLGGALGQGGPTVHAASMVEGVYDVKDFGAVGDGTTDDTSSIAAAIAACHTGGGGMVYFPPGNYLTGPQTLGSNMQVIGAGIGTTVLTLKNGSNGNVLAGVVASNITVSQLTIDANADNQTSGGGIVFYKCKQIWLDRIQVIDSHTIGVSMSEVMDSRVSNCHLKGTKVNAVLWFGSADPAYEAGNNEVVGCILEEGVLDGIIYNTNRGTITNNVIRNNGLVVNNTASGLYINGKKGTIIANNLFEYNDGNGIDVINCTEIISEGNWCNDNNSAGIMYSNTTNSVINGNICKNNGKSPATHQDDGITILGQSTRNVISNNRCFDDQAVKTQKYGIESRDSSNYLLITGNIVAGNSSGGITTVGSNNMVSNNMS